MNSKYKDNLVGVYAPGNYGHTSVLDQTQEFSRWFGLIVRIWNLGFQRRAGTDNYGS